MTQKLNKAVTMKQRYRIRAISREGLASLDMFLNCAQTQINKALYSLAYCMANDGSWDNISLFVERRAGRENLASIDFKH